MFFNLLLLHVCKKMVHINKEIYMHFVRCVILTIIFSGAN